MGSRRTRRRVMLAIVGVVVVGAPPPQLAAAGMERVHVASALSNPTSPACAGRFSTLRDGSVQGIARTVSADNPELSTFVAAVEAAGLTDVLDGDAPLTIFAPTNAAFDTIPENVLTAILADRDLLTSILNNHLVPESQSAAALAEAGMATTLNGGALRFALDGEVFTINGFEATVVCADVAVASGTMHVIDALLLPTVNDLVEGSPSSGPGTSTSTTTTTTTTTPTTTTTTTTTEVSTTTTTGATSTTDPLETTTTTTGASSTTDPLETTTSTIGGSTTSLAGAGGGSTTSLAGPGGGTLPGTGSSSTARHIAQGAALLLAFGGLCLAVTRRRRHA